MNEIASPIIRLIEVHGPLAVFVLVYALKQIGFFNRFRRNNKINNNNPHITTVTYLNDKIIQTETNDYWEKELKRFDSTLEIVDEDMRKFGKTLYHIRDGVRHLIIFHNSQHPKDQIDISKL